MKVLPPERHHRADQTAEQVRPTITWDLLWYDRRKIRVATSAPCHTIHTRAVLVLIGIGSTHRQDIHITTQDVPGLEPRAFLTRSSRLQDINVAPSPIQPSERSAAKAAGCLFIRLQVVSFAVEVQRNIFLGLTFEHKRKRVRFARHNPDDCHSKEA